MKIVQSFWSKPLLMKNKDVYQNRFDGGWINYRYALLAIAYSCLTITKYYPDLELYTDDYGIKLFKDELDLPYKVYHKNLNNIDVDVALWAFSKIYTYSLQEEPFLHVDNDIFIWDRFPKAIEKALVACQNIEWINSNNTDDYIKILAYIRENIPSISSIIKNSKAEFAVNMGIFGGNDIDFIHDYVCESMNMVNNIYHDIIKSGKNKGRFNIIFEQLYLSEYAKYKKEPIIYLQEASSTLDITRYFTIESAQYDSKFTHCLGALKQSNFICEQIEYHMKQEYPFYYQKIINFLNKNNLKYSVNEQSMKQYPDFEQIYSKIGKATSKSDILSNYLVKLKDNYKIISKGDEFFLVSENDSRELHGWGKAFAYFSDYISGESLSEYLYSNHVLPFNLDEIRQALFYLILQGLYMDKCLIVK